MPHQPEEWYEGRVNGIQHLTPLYEEWIFKQVFTEDYCATDRFKQLYLEITQILHSDIPALLPNQVVPYANLNFFNATPAPLPTNPYHPNDTRRKRDTSNDIDSNPELLPYLEVQRALDYYFKYGDPISLEEDTITTEEYGDEVQHREKRFLGALVRGITPIFKGGNIFGKIVSGIKKVGGFIFKGIKGLLHRQKNTALIQAAKAFATRSKRFLVGKLYKFQKFRGLHLGRSSLSTTLKRTWHRSKFWLRNHFAEHFSKIVHRYNNIVLWSRNAMFTKILYRVRTQALLNYTNAMISFVNYRQESLYYLEKT